MTTVQIRLYDLFRKELNLPDDKAAAYVTAEGDIVDCGVNEGNNAQATKDDIHKLELKIEQTNLKIEQSKNDIYKAVYFTSLLQFLGIVGAVIAIIKYMIK